MCAITVFMILPKTLTQLIKGAVRLRRLQTKNASTSKQRMPLARVKLHYKYDFTLCAITVIIIVPKTSTQIIKSSVRRFQNKECLHFQTKDATAQGAAWGPVGWILHHVPIELSQKIDQELFNW